MAIGINEKLGELFAFSERLRQQEAQKHFIDQLSKYNIELDSFDKDLVELNRVSPKVASQIKQQADAFAKLYNIEKLDAEGLKELGIQLGVTKKKLDSWEERFNKLRSFVEGHLGEISGTALGTVAVKKSAEALNSAVDAMVQTTGELGDNWDSAAGHAFKMSKQLLGVQMASAGLVDNLGDLRDITDKYYRLYRTGGDASQAISGFAALQHAFGTDMGEMSEFMESRQKRFNQTAEESVGELAGVHLEFRKAYENIGKFGTETSKAARIWETDFYQIVKGAAEEISDSGTDMHALARVMRGAYEYASKLQLTMEDTKKLMGGIGKLFKLPDVMELKGAADILAELQGARRKGGGAEDQVYKKYFRDAEATQAKSVLKMLETGELSMTTGSAEVMRLLAHTGEGMALQGKLQLEYLRRYARTGDAQVQYLEHTLGIPPDTVQKVYQVIRSGQFESLLRKMGDKGEGLDKLGDEIDQLQDDGKSQSAVALEKLKADERKNERTTIQRAEALVLNPITAAVGSLAIFAGAAAWRVAQNRFISSQLVIQNAALAAKLGEEGLGEASNLVDGGARKEGSVLGRLGKRLFGKKGGVAAGELAGAAESAVGGEVGSVLAGASKTVLGGAEGALAGGGVKGVLAKMGGALAKSRGLLGGLGRVGKVIPVVGPLLFSAFDAYSQYKESGTKGLIKSLGGAAGGVIGGVFGGPLGAIAGAWAGEKLTSLAEDWFSKSDPKASPRADDPASMTPNAATTIQEIQRNALSDPDALARAALKASGVSQEAGASQDVGIKARAIGINQDGSLTLEWTNPQAVASLMRTTAAMAK